MNSEGLRSRAAALQILNRVLGERLFLDDSSTSSELSPADRAFARRLVETALRHWGHLNLIKLQLLERPLPDRALEADRLILLGLAQLLFMETASHAAVSTAVDLVAKSASRRVRPLKGLANAVLRRAARDKSLLLNLVEAEPLKNLPSWLQKIWVGQFGNDMAAGLARAQSRPPMLDLTFRSNQTAESWLRKNGGQQLLPGSVRVEERGAVSELPGYASGEWWVQDLAASLPVRLLGDISGLAVADLCAAPGGKTMQLAASWVAADGEIWIWSRIDAAQADVAVADTVPLPPGRGQILRIRAAAVSHGTLR